MLMKIHLPSICRMPKGEGACWDGVLDDFFFFLNPRGGVRELAHSVKCL